MSRTDKTRPFWVRLRDYSRPYPRRTDHELGGYWQGELRCGCATCQDQDGRKARARKERHEGKRQPRALLDA